MTERVLVVDDSWRKRQIAQGHLEAAAAAAPDWTVLRSLDDAEQSLAAHRCNEARDLLDKAPARRRGRGARPMTERGLVVEDSWRKRLVAQGDLAASIEEHVR
jgi:hypothetical protein